MENDLIKRIIDDPYDGDVEKDSFIFHAVTFYSKKMRWLAIWIWVWFLIFLAPLVYSAIQFFRTESIRHMIMYASIFVCCVAIIAVLKAMAWIILSMALVSSAWGLPTMTTS